MVRLHYLDNLRWMTILAVILFHAAMVFCAGYGYYVLSAVPLGAARCITVAVEPWIMLVLFCIAGMSARFALMKRTPAVFVKERVMRLLVPFVAGVVLICPVVAYYALRFHTGYDGSFAGAFVHFFTSADIGQLRRGVLGDFSIDHLWFLVYLFAISVLALGVVLLCRRVAKPRPLPAGAGCLPVLVLLAIPLWLLNAWGILVAGYSFVSYFAAFLFGYFLFTTGGVQARLEKYWAGLLFAWAALTIGVMWVWGIFLGHSEVFWGTSPLYVLTGWTGALALLGTGKRLLDRHDAVTAYLTAASYPVYILHQPVLVAVAYYAVMLNIPTAVQFAAVVLLSVLLTFACYEIIRRIPVVRALFGVNGSPPADGEENGDPVR